MFEWIAQLDGQLLLWINQTVQMPILDDFILIFTALGNSGAIWIVCSLVMLCWKKTRKIGFWALISMLLGLLITNVTIKPLVARSRPWLVVDGLSNLIESSDPNSFPSGHTCAAFAAGFSWALHVNQRWLKVLCVGQAVLMGYSRLHVGVHFPTDVLAGAVIGTMCAWLAWKLEKRYKPL